MAGIYIHIPFCKSRCRYCDFYSTTSLDRRAEYVGALKEEMRLRKDDFVRQLAEKQTVLSTVYFGGGTPSTLCESDIVGLIGAIRTSFDTSKLDEITMEANPGDLTEEKLLLLRQSGVNRLSIGIQSFSDPLLSAIGRRHSGAQAIEAVRMAQQAGFRNISIDLMYGLPGQTREQWIADVRTAVSLDIQHVSAYCLTYEEGTPLYRALMKGEVSELEDDTLNWMQDYLEEELKKVGIIRYEISNYARDGLRSVHNGSYWTGAPYLGLGAGAHSYDGGCMRMSNPDDLASYLSSISRGVLPLEYEVLTSTDMFNESVMLGLRTVEGISLSSYSPEDMRLILEEAAGFLSDGLLTLTDNRLRATHAGARILNTIIEELMKD